MSTVGARRVLIKRAAEKRSHGDRAESFAQMDRWSAEQVVCVACGKSSKNAHGHATHCGDPRSWRCRGAACIPLTEWQANAEHKASERALGTMADDHFVHKESATINSAVQDLYYDKMTSSTTVNAFKSILFAHDERCKEELMRRLGKGKTAAEKDSLLKQVADVFAVSSNLETKTQLVDRVQPAPARYRELIDRPDSDGKAQGPRQGDHVYDVPICDGLKAIVRDDPSVLSQWRAQADGWVPKRGESITVFKDITDGSFFRQHPELGVDADRSDGALRLGFICYYDEVECCNSIGNFCGVHKIGLFYWGSLNYGSEARMDLTNIHLATVVLDADVSYYGMEQIVSGCGNSPPTHMWRTRYIALCVRSPVSQASK